MVIYYYIYICIVLQVNYTFLKIISVIFVTVKLLNNIIYNKLLPGIEILSSLDKLG